MSSIAKRKQRRQQSALLKQARMKLLLELEYLEDKLCDECKNTGGQANSGRSKCSCSAATRMRLIGQELLTSVNERSKEKLNVKEVKIVAKISNAPILTEKAVNEMKASGMSYAAIAKHFGISAPTLATRRQNWELERVREQRKREQDSMDPLNKESVTEVDTTEKDMLSKHTLPTTHETEIEELKAAIIHKDEFIQKQWNTIDKLSSDRDELLSQKAMFSRWQDEIKDERKLLAILLERETERIKNLVEVG